MISDQARRSPLSPHEPTAEQRSRAVWVVAGKAQDAEDLSEVLDMLGLSACEAKEPGSAPDQAVPAQRQPRNHRLTTSELADLLTPLADSR